MPRALFTALLILGAASASAHDFAFTDVRLVLDGEGGFQADLTCDLDALALGVDTSAASAALAAEIEGLTAVERERLVQELVELLRRRVRVRFDGVPAPFEVTFPETSRPEAPGIPPSALGLVTRIAGRVPAGAREVTFFASRAFPPVRLTTRHDSTGARSSQLLLRGGESQPVPLTGPPHSAVTAARRFVGLGFAHILPHGLDHVLFVVGLALFSPRVKPLLAQVSAFTAAHTVSLALSTRGVVELPSRTVETLIGLSIVYVGVENLTRAELRLSRLAFIFAFGLLHGLGFAGALRELGWPEDRRLAALLAFNLGVELGQLTVVALALSVTALAGRCGVKRRHLDRALALGIAAFGLWLAALRAFGG